MTPTDYTLIIGAAVTALLSLWNAVTNWLDKRDRRLALDREAEAKRKELEKQAEWAEAEKAHRRKMEELAVASVRQGGLAAKKAQEAAVIAATAKEEISASRQERADQVRDLKEGQDQVKELVKEGINVSNGYNGKIADAGERSAAAVQEMQKLREDFQASKPTEPPS